MEARPKLDPSIFYATKDGKHLFLNPELPDWIVVNGNGAVILGLCNGSRSVPDIYGALGDAPGISREELSGFLDRAESRGIIASAQEANSAGQDDFIPPSPDGPSLRTVHLKLTNKCNFKCIYCYAESGKSRVEPLSLAELERIVDESLSISADVLFQLSGGEPMLHSQFLPLAEYIAARTRNSVLLTNGSLITPANAARISGLFTQVKISLDGSTAAINAKTRGRGAFNKVRRAIDLLRRNGAQVSVSMTVNKNNIGDIQNMVDEFGRTLTFAPMFPAGRGKETDAFCISGEEYYRALAEVEGVNPLSSLNETLANGRRRRITRCAMASCEISVDDFGDVYPCQLLHENEFRGGNIRQSSIRDILESETFQKLREIDVLSVKGCAECPVRLMCGAGCRARSYYECGRIDVAGEFCAYERMAYINGLLDSAVLD